MILQGVIAKPITFCVWYETLRVWYKRLGRQITVSPLAFIAGRRGKAGAATEALERVGHDMASGVS